MKSRVVFIHIGNNPPVHFWRNVEQVKRCHPTIGIDLILDSDIELQEDNQVRVFNYKSDQRLSEIFEMQQNDFSFRKGFWRYSTERLFVLAQHAVANPENSYIHIESDVFVLPQFPFEKFQELKNIWWSKYDNNRDLASIVFIPGPEESHWFLQRMYEEMSKHSDLNDMILLNRISHQYPARIRCLPTAPDQFSKIICGKYVATQEERLTISDSFPLFSGVFDSAALGIWLTGTEPRNYFGFKRMFSTAELLRTPTYINPSEADYTYSPSEGLLLIEGASKISVFNLHIHSKDLDLFGSNWEQKLTRIVEQSRRKRVRVEFLPRILLQLIRENIANGTALSFIFWMPGIRRIRRLRSFKNLKFLR